MTGTGSRGGQAVSRQVFSAAVGVASAPSGPRRGCARDRVRPAGWRRTRSGDADRDECEAGDQEGVVGRGDDPGHLRPSADERGDEPGEQPEPDEQDRPVPAIQRPSRPTAGIRRSESRMPATIRTRPAIPETIPTSRTAAARPPSAGTASGSSATVGARGPGRQARRGGVEPRRPSRPRPRGRGWGRARSARTRRRRRGATRW